MISITFKRASLLLIFKWNRTFSLPRLKCLTETTESSLPFPHLWRCRCVSIAGQHLQRDAPAAVPQQLLEFMRVAADLTTVHLTDYIPCMQHALPVNRTAMQNPRDHHLSLFHAESHSLEESRSHLVSNIRTSLITQQVHFMGLVCFGCCERSYSC